MNNVKSIRRLLVLVPAYNEQEKIDDTIRAIKRTFPNLQDMGLVASVYVIDDGSVDETGNLAEQAGADRVLIEAPWVKRNHADGKLKSWNCHLYCFQANHEGC